jgi:hypothetical protein
MHDNRFCVAICGRGAPDVSILIGSSKGKFVIALSALQLLPLLVAARVLSSSGKMCEVLPANCSGGPMSAVIKTYNDNSSAD